MDSLFQSPPIIENIFKHLCARDLCTFAQTAEHPPGRTVENNETVECYDIGHYDMEEDIRRSDIISENNYRRCVERYGIKCGLGEKLKKQLNSLSIKSSFCLAFVSESLMNDSEYLFSNLLPEEPFLKKQKTRAVNFPIAKRCDRSVMKHLLATHLPPRSKYTYVVAPGVVGCCNYNTSIEVEDGYSITGFCIPEMPGVKIQFYDFLKCNLEDIISEKNKAKCLLVFESCSGPTRAKLHMIIDKRVKSNPNLAIGGASLRNINKVIVFSGENVEAASLIIRRRDNKNELKNKLKLFEETGLLENRCFAFMFACVARGYEFHKEHNFESATFHSLYPKVPLTGLFGDGEIGVNFLPSNGATPSTKFPDQRKHFYSYSTVFVLVSIKN